MQNLQIEAKLEPIWSTVRNIRKRIREDLAGYPEKLRSATAMVASELLENAVKYGEAVPEAPTIDFTFTLENEIFTIVVSNGSSSSQNVDRLMEHIAALQDAGNGASLYLSRLEALLREPSQTTGLGIYRIGYEGGYNLACTYTDNVVTVTATRSCNAC